MIMAEVYDVINFLASMVAAIATVYLFQLMVHTKDDTALMIQIQRVILAALAAVFMWNAFIPSLENHDASPGRTALVVIAAIWITLRCFMRQRAVEAQRRLNQPG